MRRNFRRRMGPQVQASKLETIWQGADYAIVQPLGNDGGTPLLPGGDPQRIMWWNPVSPSVVNSDSVNTITANLTARLRRIIFQQNLWAIVTRYGATGGTFASVATTRQTNPYYGEGGTSGAVLEGGISNTFDQATISHLEGVPVHWALLYETDEEAGQPLATTFSFSSASELVRNRKVFAQGGFVVNLANPRTFKLDKKFGRGITLSSGDRQTWQVTLAMFIPGIDGGNDAYLGSSVAVGRAFYEQLR